MANIDLFNIRDIFVTHNHIDHITGIIWVIRQFCIMMRKSECHFNVNIYASKDTIQAIKIISSLILSKNQANEIGNKIILCEITDREERVILGERFLFYDILATKERQFGFKVFLSCGKTLMCNGDEGLKEDNYDLAKGCDYLIHEAFCLESEAIVKEPHKIGHTTAKEVCMLANELDIKNLILYHISNEDIDNRQQKYYQENKPFFKNNLFIPNDLEIIEIKGE